MRRGAAREERCDGGVGGRGRGVARLERAGEGRGERAREEQRVRLRRAGRTEDQTTPGEESRRLDEENVSRCQ